MRLHNWTGGDAPDWTARTSALRLITSVVAPVQFDAEGHSRSSAPYRRELMRCSTKEPAASGSPHRSLRSRQAGYSAFWGRHDGWRPTHESLCSLTGGIGVSSIVMEKDQSRRPLHEENHPACAI